MKRISIITTLRNAVMIAFTCSVLFIGSPNCLWADTMMEVLGEISQSNQPDIENSGVGSDEVTVVFSSDEGGEEESVIEGYTVDYDAGSAAALVFNAEFTLTNGSFTVPIPQLGATGGVVNCNNSTAGDNEDTFVLYGFTPLGESERTAYLVLVNSTISLDSSDSVPVYEIGSSISITPSDNDEPFTTTIVDAVTNNTGCSSSGSDSGSLYVVGTTSGLIGDDVINESLNGGMEAPLKITGKYGGGTDIFLAAYDFNGNRQWLVQSGEEANEQALAVTLDESDNIYITGYTDGDFAGNINTGNNDILLAKYDKNGNNLWFKLLGTPITDSSDYFSGWDSGSDIAVDSNNNIYITGSTYGDLDGNANAGGSDAFIAKYDSKGDKQWVRLLGTASSDNGKAIAIDSGNNIYITGSTYGDLGGNSKAGFYDAFVAKYDPVGELQWVELIGTSSNENVNDIAIAGESIFIVGKTGDNYENAYVAAIVESAFSAPLPNIKANGSDGPIKIKTTDTVTLSLGLEGESYEGVDSDWWIIQYSPGDNWYYFNAFTWEWDYLDNIVDLVLTYQGPLMSFPITEMMSVSDLMQGSYMFYFAVDMEMDGILSNELYYDYVEAIVE